MLACIDLAAGSILFVAGIVLMACSAIGWFQASRWYNRSADEGGARIKAMGEMLREAGYGHVVESVDRAFEEPPD